MKILSEADYKVLADKAAECDSAVQAKTAAETDRDAAIAERDQQKSANEQLVKDRDAEKARADKAEKALTDAQAAHKTEQEAKEKDVDRRASLKAAEITSGIGTDPVAAKPGNGAKSGTLAEQLEQIKDPVARAKFIKANRDALTKEAAAALKK